MSSLDRRSNTTNDYGNDFSLLNLPETCIYIAGNVTINVNLGTTVRLPEQENAEVYSRLA